MFWEVLLSIMLWVSQEFGWSSIVATFLFFASFSCTSEPHLWPLISSFLTSQNLWDAKSGMTRRKAERLPFFQQLFIELGYTFALCVDPPVVHASYFFFSFFSFFFFFSSFFVFSVFLLLRFGGRWWKNCYISHLSIFLIFLFFFFFLIQNTRGMTQPKIRMRKQRDRNRKENQNRVREKERENEGETEQTRALKKKVF